MIIVRIIPIYFFLCLMCVSQLSPVFRVLNDTLQHTFNQVNHIATIHFENGKYHLHHELQNDSEKAPTGTNDFSTQKIESITPTNVLTFNDSFIKKTEIKIFLRYAIGKPSNGFQLTFSPPPRLS